MQPLPTLLGILLGAGALLVAIGFRKLTNKSQDEDQRKKGFWPLNAGLVLAALSMYMMASN
ncbi:MAG: hypothetical protein CFH41_02479 [Alphaproteobacteria bacterium MarineAlpha11_Bin1]|nr:MAG: hypothetical protein CFH41_02479 [Alphaproteobacteria bacterium MarineAlpha11_Bin1]